MRKIRIAITADTLSDPAVPLWQDGAPYAPRDLCRILASLGAIPVILPDTAAARGEDYLVLYDGLIIPGGPDTAPHFFGEEPHQEIGPTNEKRDIFEWEILRAAAGAGKPILGICRGMQLFNIFRGGNVYQDLSLYPSVRIQHAQKTPDDQPSHHISIKEDSLLSSFLGPSAFVNSRHHQSIRRIGDGLSVTARAPDGVIEGIESDDRLFLGVQWHPESLSAADPRQLRIFQWLIDRADV